MRQFAGVAAALRSDVGVTRERSGTGRSPVLRSEEVDEFVGGGSEPWRAAEGLAQPENQGLQTQLAVRGLPPALATFLNGLFGFELEDGDDLALVHVATCLIYTSPSPRDRGCSRMPSYA